MNLDQADAIIAELNICFPSRQLLVEEVKRWEDNLLQFHFDDAKKAVKRIEETSRFWPSWAEFREAGLPLHKNRIWLEDDQKEKARLALEPARTPEETAEIAKIIKQIKNGLLKKS